MKKKEDALKEYYQNREREREKNQWWW